MSEEEIVSGQFCFLLFDMVWLTLVWLNRFDVGFFFSFSFSGYNFSFRNIRNGNFIWNLKNRCWFQIWSNLELVLKKDEIFVSSEFRKFEIVNLLATYIDCIAKVGTFFFNSSTSILKFSILWMSWSQRESYHVLFQSVLVRNQKI